MCISVKQVSSLEKIRSDSIGAAAEFTHKTVMRGQFFSYQIAVSSSARTALLFEIESELKQGIDVYFVKNVVMDFPTYEGADDDYLEKQPALMPDLLLPARSAKIKVNREASALWITVRVPETIAAGEYTITTMLTSADPAEAFQVQQVLYLDVIDASIGKQKTLFTQWFHTDCIADIHHVPVYSSEHWALIEKYVSLACDLGINTILTPIISPPLDTAEGHMRTCTQLVKIEKCGSSYTFDFTLLGRWITLCRKCGIQYFEMSQLFSQWGLKYAPNIRGRENGQDSDLFGWHTPANSEAYAAFLKQFLPSLIAYLKAAGVKEACFFHLSDEPQIAHLDAYRAAYDLVKPLIDGCPILDALSSYEFYENKLVDIPVTKSDYIHHFLEHRIPNQWVYYCCSQFRDVGNRFIAMPSYRNRILGLQMYKYDVKGFLHWGYNFYNSRLSLEKINPYVTTSADKEFPSGDPFSVYPIQDGVVPSLRAFVFKEALSDIEVCRKLEEYVGREQVVALIDAAAGMNLTFSDYPRTADFILNLMEQITQAIKKQVQ